MVWTPPVNIPSLSDRDYGAQLFDMLSSTGDAFRQNRRDRIGDEQRAQEQQRLRDAMLFDQSMRERNYALELQKFEANQADPGSGDEWYGTPQWYEMDDGSMGFGIISKGGDFKEMPPPEGSKWAPRVTYQDTGTARVPTYTQGGSVVPGGALPVHGPPETGTVQTSPGAVPGSPGMGVPGLPGGGVVPTYEPVGPKATREQEQYERETTSTRVKTLRSLGRSDQQTQFVEQTIDEAIALIAPWTTGFGAVLANLPATDARALARNLDTIRANIGFGELQAIRDASPTGGALGPVSDFENRLLQAVQGALDQYQRGEDIADALQKIKALRRQTFAVFKLAYMVDHAGLDVRMAEMAMQAISAGENPDAVLAEAEAMTRGG